MDINSKTGGYDLMTKAEPQSRDEILAALEDLRDQGLAFWTEFPPEVFAAPIGDAWSPADNVRHLIKSTLPVAKALKLPRLVLRTLFGPATIASSSYGELIARYQAILAGGGKAGKFAPRTVDVPDNLEAWQRKLVSVCRDSLSDLNKAVESWSDSDLDRYRLPHPLLGKITLREMLFFTLYHFTHHRGNVVRRMARA
jgi:hypothetical protein